MMLARVCTLFFMLLTFPQYEHMRRWMGIFSSHPEHDFLPFFLLLVGDSFGGFLAMAFLLLGKGLLSYMGLAGGGLFGLIFPEFFAVRAGFFSSTFLGGLVCFPICDTVIQYHKCFLIDRAISLAFPK